MPIQLKVNKAHKMGKVASPSSTGFLALPIPIVPKTHLLNVVLIGNKGIMGMHKRIYARKSLKCLGIDMGTRRMLCAKN